VTNGERIDSTPLDDAELPARQQHSIAQAIAALSLFVAFYVAMFFAGGYLLALAGLYFGQWITLLAVSIATIATVAILEGGHWRLGLFVAPRLAVRECLFGCGAAVLLIAAADGLVMLTTRLRHVAGNGFPWFELIAVYLPAVFHEELLFRGYPFQKLWRMNRLVAVAFTSIVFAALHGGNNAVSVLAMINLFLAGILLALAYA
jgi:membrane protease YdiL (CAAX protease family)